MLFDWESGTIKSIRVPVQVPAGVSSLLAIFRLSGDFSTRLLPWIPLRVFELVLSSFFFVVG